MEGTKQEKCYREIDKERLYKKPSETQGQRGPPPNGAKYKGIELSERNILERKKREEKRLKEWN